MEAMKMKKLPLSSNQKYFIIRTKGAPKAIEYAEAYADEVRAGLVRYFRN